MFKNKPKQLSFLDLYSHIKNSAIQQPESLLGLFDKFIDLSEFISSFYLAYHKYFGKNRNFSLQSMLCAFFVQKILKLNTLTQLRAVLSKSYELRSFCNFENVPSISTFSRFRKLFALEIKKLFNNLAIHAHNIAIDHYPDLASTLIFDTTGLEPNVRENNPKFFQSLFKKTSHKNPNLELKQVYSLVYHSLSKTSKANPNIHVMFVNGHFCYDLKFVIITNAIGFPLAILPLFDLNSNNPDPIVDKAISGLKAPDTFSSKTFSLYSQQFLHFHC